MNNYHAKYDPTYYHIVACIKQCSYGLNEEWVIQHCLMFLKQFSGFVISAKNVQYGMSPQIKLLVLTGGIPIKYQMKDYQIPINLILPSTFPTSAPKVQLNYKLDEKSALENPLVKHGNEILNNYLHKWDGTNNQYNLGGLWYNLSKSFSLYPPLGTAGGGTLSSDVIYIADGASKPAPSNVIKKDYNVETEPPKVPEHLKIHKMKEEAMTEEEQLEAVIREERKDNISKLKNKIESKLTTLNSSVSGLDSEPGQKDLIAKSKEFLEANSEQLKKQTLMLEGEISELKEATKTMRDFIAKNKGTDVSEVRSQILKIFNSLFKSDCNIGKHRRLCVCVKRRCFWYVA